MQALCVNDIMKYAELSKFASWFHQDYGVLYKNPKLGVDDYLNSLAQDQQKKLFLEINDLLKEYYGKENTGLKNAWLRLGAQWWNKDQVPKILNNLAAKVRK